MKNHPESIHVPGKTLVFGITEERPDEIDDAPCQDCAVNNPAAIPPPLPPEVELGLKLGLFPPW